MAVGVGRGVDEAELEVIAGDPSRVLYATDYNNLDSILNKLRKVITLTAATTLEG